MEEKIKLEGGNAVRHSCEKGVLGVNDGGTKKEMRPYLAEQQIKRQRESRDRGKE